MLRAICVWFRTDLGERLVQDYDGEIFLCVCGWVLAVIWLSVGAMREYVTLHFSWLRRCSVVCARCWLDDGV